MNEEERLKTFAKSPTETLRKCLGFDFLHGNNFPQQFQVNTKCQEGWTPSFFTPPSIYSKIGEELATQLAQASQVASSRSNRLLEEESGRPKWVRLLFAPPFLLNTPLCFFWWFFFRNVTKLYEFRNDTCFLFVRLWNLTDHVITPFLAFEKLQKLTDCVTILPFDFRHVSKLHILCNKGCQEARSGQSKVGCHQTIVPGRN